MAYLKLKETHLPDTARKIDIWGNLAFLGGLTIFLIGVTYALLPYGADPMGWRDPWVIASLFIGVVLLIAFPIIESRVADPMFMLIMLQSILSALTPSMY